MGGLARLDCPASVDDLENGNPDAVHHSDSELSADRIQLQVVAILQLLGAQDRLLIIFTNDDRRWPHDVPVRSYGVNAIGRHRSTEGPSGLQNNVNSYHIGGCPSVGWPTNQGKKRSLRLESPAAV